MSVIFLAGVHGVGKGFLGAPVARTLGVDHFTASQLIREEKGHSTWGTDKRVSDFDDNQLALIQAVKKRSGTGKDMLLDGHFVLRAMSGELVPLAKEVFAELQFSAVILLTDDVEVIVGRLLSRDGVVVNPETVNELSASESAHASNVCQTLQVPLVVLHRATVQTLIDVVIQFLKK